MSALSRPENTLNQIYYPNKSLLLNGDNEGSISMRLSLQTDLVFKAVFGRDTIESKILLIDLINTILNRKGADKITDITHKNPFVLQKDIDDKAVILDIKAETNIGELIDIEMQVNYNNLYRSRSLYYWAKLHSNQLSKGENYQKVMKSISINIMAKACFDESMKNHLTFKVMEVEEQFILSNDLEIHYVQLPMFDDTIEVELMDRLTEWMTFLKDIHLHEKKSVIKKIVSKEGVMQLAYEEYSKVTDDEILKEKLEARQKYIWDRNTEKELAVEEGYNRGLEEGLQHGVEKGLEQGLEQGERNKAIAVAKGLLNLLDDMKIAEVTGLSVEDIMKLRKSKNAM